MRGSFATASALAQQIASIPPYYRLLLTAALLAMAMPFVLLQGRHGLLFSESLGRGSNAPTSAEVPTSSAATHAVCPDASMLWTFTAALDEHDPSQADVAVVQFGFNGHPGFGDPSLAWPWRVVACGVGAWETPVAAEYHTLAELVSLRKEFFNMDIDYTARCVFPAAVRATLVRQVEWTHAHYGVAKGVSAWLVLEGPGGARCVAPSATGDVVLPRARATPAGYLAVGTHPQYGYCSGTQLFPLWLDQLLDVHRVDAVIIYATADWCWRSHARLADPRVSLVTFSKRAISNLTIGLEGAGAVDLFNRFRYAYENVLIVDVDELYLHPHGLLLPDAVRAMRRYFPRTNSLSMLTFLARMDLPAHGVRVRTDARNPYIQRKSVHRMRYVDGAYITPHHYTGPYLPVGSFWDELFLPACALSVGLFGLVAMVARWPGHSTPVCVLVLPVLLLACLMPTFVEKLVLAVYPTVSLRTTVVLIGFALVALYALLAFSLWVASHGLTSPVALGSSLLAPALVVWFWAVGTLQLGQTMVYVGYDLPLGFTAHCRYNAHLYIPDETLETLPLFPLK